MDVNLNQHSKYAYSYINYFYFQEKEITGNV